MLGLATLSPVEAIMSDAPIPVVGPHANLVQPDLFPDSFRRTLADLMASDTGAVAFLHRTLLVPVLFAPGLLTMATAVGV